MEEKERPKQEKDGESHQPPGTMSRRFMLLKLGIALNTLAGALLAVPVVGYLASAARKKSMIDALAWIPLGDVDRFPEGQTRLATFRNPLTMPWDGAAGDVTCWVRRLDGEEFQVFAINCTHLGCPVRWFPQSELFMCPCHGGAYYADGMKASGPPPRGLFRYQSRIEHGKLLILGGMMPTLGHQRARAGTDGRPPCA
jgi:menaquinol-cytochrome c reductase iron-sulfur subunit